MGEAIRIERASAQVTDALRAAFRGALSTTRGTFEQREGAALALANEIVRDFLCDELQSMATDFGDEVTVESQTYRRCGEGTVRYHTLCGPVAIRRATYRLVGVHNGPTVVPLELRAGLSHNATPALAFSTTQAFATGPLRDYETAMSAAHRRVPSRSTLERIGKRTGAEIEEVVAGLEPMVRIVEPVVDGVCSISMGLDRTTVPMAEPIPDVESPEPRIRRRPQPVTVAYRMAYVGTVSLHDHDGNVLVTKRFGATAEEGPDRIVERIAAELRHQRARYDAPISIIQDGAHELWNLVAGMCAHHGIPIADGVIDRFHVDERLADVCLLATGNQAGARELYDAWRYQLDHSDTSIEQIVRRTAELVWHCEYGFAEGDPAPTFWLRRGVVELPAEARTSIAEHLAYFRRDRHRIRYATRRRAGLPIGSGPTEGACKSLVTARFKRSGQRWFESGLAPCLSLRALHLSDRLRAAFVLNASAQTSRLAAA
jgi:hypothetical protein